MKSRSELQIGDSVVVKPGVKDEDTGGDLSGWQGCITEFDLAGEDGPLICLAWDSLTLRRIPRAVLERSEEEGYDWRTYYLPLSEVEPAAARDNEADVADALEDLESQTAWLGLGAEGARIQAVLNSVALADEWGQLNAWEAHLEQRLQFPFEAEIKEGEHYGRVRVGERVVLTGFNETDDLYGLLVNARRGREHFVLPLCDLAATDKRSQNYQPLRDYVVWFANR